jgi:aldehyde dehydrogenase family protein
LSTPHFPCLRFGRAYESVDKFEVKDHRTGEVKAVVSYVNSGLVERDRREFGAAQAALQPFTVAELITRSTTAGDLFLHGTLPLGDRGHTQSVQDYVATLSATSGLPFVMVRDNMARLHAALTHVGEILNGLSRGLDLRILDMGMGEQFGTRLAFFPTTTALGLVMPSNSPAVNALWVPALALKTPVVIKPGREELWTPYRLIQAFIAAGVPSEAFGFYPTDYDGAAAILNNCGRAVIFGDDATTQHYATNPGIQIHGPGRSKVILGEDCIDDWHDYLDVLISAIVDNGGRSCTNASAIVVPRHADAISDALAQQLGPIAPKCPEDSQASLSGFANPRMAEAINAEIEAGLKAPGAVDVTARHRSGPRKVVFEGGTFLRPTIVRCDSFAHTLANREFLFPFASVIEVPQSEMLKQIDDTLVVSAITKDPAFIAQLMGCRQIDRLNVGPVSTMTTSWDQPHEGNLFEFLWQRRSFVSGW